MAAANKEIDPTEEEAKGGSLKVGKMFLSAGDARLALECHCPQGPGRKRTRPRTSAARLSG